MEEEAPFDTSNPNAAAFYDQVPVRLLAANIKGKPKAMITLRVATTTLTFGLSKQDIDNWIGVLETQKKTMSGIIVPPKQIILPPNGQR